MYEELVDRLRNLSRFEIKNAESVIHVSAEAVARLRELAKEAADAIEELNRENESLAKSVNEASEILRKRWIPVTERLPEPKFVREWYLVSLESGCVKSLVFEKENGWHDTASPVTHWMPLPEPPKEET